MAKRIVRQLDEARSALLCQSELFVLKNIKGKTGFYARLINDDVDRCPVCGEVDLKNQGLFEKVYIDYLPDNHEKHVIFFTYQFNKYKCLNKQCHHIFSKSIGFASQRDHVTHRFEKEIVKRIINGDSYDTIAKSLSYSVTRQAVGQIFIRWVKGQEEARRIKTTPSTLAIISGKTDKDQYTLFLSLDKTIRILDIILGVSSLDIIGWIRRLDLDRIETVITDCDPVIVDTINDYLPQITYIIPVYYWFKLVAEDFKEYSRELLRWSQVRNKDSIIMLSESELGFNVSSRNKLLETRPAIRQPYKDYNELRETVFNREKLWTINDLDAWVASADPDLQKHLNATILRLNMYKDLIYQHELHREQIPNNLYQLSNDLESYVSKAKTISDAQLKARVLYSVPADLEDWRGIPIEEAISALRGMNK